MTPETSTSNSHILIGVGDNKKDSAWVSCYGYGESTKISPNVGDFVQEEFTNPLFDVLDFILVGSGEKGVNCGKFILKNSGR